MVVFVDSQLVSQTAKVRRPLRAPSEAYASVSAKVFKKIWGFLCVSL